MLLVMYRDNYFLFPLLHQIEHTAHYDEKYASNDMGYWLYPPLDENMIVDKIIFYFNGNAGNNSTRVCMIEILRHLLPEYTIVQLEYPGYGISAHLPLSFQNMIDQCHDTIQEYLSLHPNIVTVGFWGESIGAYVQGLVMKKLHRSPDWIVQVNGVCDLQACISHILPIWTHVSILPFMRHYPSLYELYKGLKNTHVFIFQSDHDDTIPLLQSKQLYVTLKANQKAFHCTLKGGHNLVLHSKENQARMSQWLRILQ